MGGSRRELSSGSVARQLRCLNYPLPTQQNPFGCTTAFIEYTYGKTRAFGHRCKQHEGLFYIAGTTADKIHIW